MTPSEAVALFTSALDRVNVRYIIVGSVASMFYGDPRMTRDVDIVVKLSDVDVDPLLASFPEPEFYVSRDAAMQVARLGGQFNVIHVPSGFKADLVKARAGAFEAEQFERARRVEVLPGLVAWIAAPEHVIVAKLLYFDEGKSDKHLRDVASMLRVQGSRIDRECVGMWADRFAVAPHWLAAQARANAK